MRSGSRACDATMPAYTNTRSHRTGGPVAGLPQRGHGSEPMPRAPGERSVHPVTLRVTPTGRLTAQAILIVAGERR
jgi:hypothetical protein